MDARDAYSDLLLFKLHKYYAMPNADRKMIQWPEVQNSKQGFRKYVLK